MNLKIKYNDIRVKQQPKELKMARPTWQSDNWDYKVESVKLLTPEGKESGWMGNRRVDDGTVLGVCTEQYGIIDNGPLLEKAESAFEKAGLDFEREVVVSNNGARMRALYDFPNTTMKIPAVGDEMGFRLLVNNSFDRTLRVSFELGMLRLLCTNGMTTLEREIGLTRKHSTKLNIDDLITDTALDCALEKFKNAGNVFSRLAETTVSQEDGLFILGNLAKKNFFSEKVRENVATVWNSPEYKEDEGRNLYNLYNALTQHLTREVSDTRFEYSNRISNTVLTQLRKASLQGATMKKLITPIEDNSVIKNN